MTISNNDAPAIATKQDAASVSVASGAVTPKPVMNDDDSLPALVADTASSSIGSQQSLSISRHEHDHNDFVDTSASMQVQKIEAKSEIDIASPLHPRIDSPHTTYTSHAALENQDSALYKDLGNLSGFDTEHEPQQSRSTNSSHQLTMTSELEDYGSSNPSTPDRDAKPIVKIMSTASTREIATEGHRNESTSSRSSSETPLQPENSATSSSLPAAPTRRRNSHNSRLRHRPLHQMESISETRIVNDSTESTTVGDSDGFMEDSFVSLPVHGINMDSTDRTNYHSQHPDNIDSVASTSSSLSTPRRRTGAIGDSPGSTSGNSHSSDSAQGGSNTGGSGARRHRHGLRGDIGPARRRYVAENSNDGNENTGIRRRPINRGNSLSIQLDAGMASLRRWIRARRSTVDGGDTGVRSTSGQSLSSITTMRLGEDDIFALSHTGRDPRRSGVASSTSSDPSMNISETNSSSGFLYYRPFEVHIPHDVDAEIGVYGSDDESGTRSILLHPLVSTETSRVDERGSRHMRQRAYSEPDRARIVDFFSSIFGSRAIDGGNVADGIAPERNDARYRQSRLRNLNTRTVVSTSPIIMEEAEVIDQDNDQTDDQTFDSGGDRSTRQQSQLSDDRQIPALTVEESEARLRTTPPSSGIDAESPTDIGPSIAGAPRIPDPDREARTRWMRINRQFRCIITSVAVIFSLLLFCILISWVLLISTFVLSHNKQCDVPLRAYFLLVSIQLMLDVFRAEIMKWLCRWRTDSQRRIPPRVIIYNVAYLVYAMLVLRMGVRSVFVIDSSCSTTAPELFYASLIFVCLSLVAWATIFLGYFIPFIFVAVLLTQNGYFPNGDIASSRGVMGGRRARIGSGRIGGILGEVFPNTYGSPVPYGFVDRLRVVLLNEFPATYQKDCCICMMDYKDGEVIVATPCEHLFHKRCLQEWFQLSRTCPVCRTDVPEALGMTETTGATSEDDGNRSISLSESDELRGENNVFGRDENQQISSFIRFVRRERMQASEDISNRTGVTSVGEQSATANAVHNSNGDNNQGNHLERMHNV